MIFRRLCALLIDADIIDDKFAGDIFGIFKYLVFLIRLCNAYFFKKFSNIFI